MVNFWQPSNNLCKNKLDPLISNYLIFGIDIVQALISKQNVISLVIRNTVMMQKVEIYSEGNC